MTTHVHVRVKGELLDAIRVDLHRRHDFAYERVGFCRAALSWVPSGLLIVIQDYKPVDDADYENVSGAGATIGSDAMRKAVQWAYRPKSALFHIHTHGGRGKPCFSGVDLRSAAEYVPGFFETVPRAPHGIFVLSNDSAAGLVWLAAGARPQPVTRFSRIGAPLRHDWSDR